MSVVKFSEVAHRANTKEDRFNTDKIYYVGGEHIEPGELFIHDKGIIKGSTIGPMFYCGFKSGQILFVTRNPHLRKCSVAEFDGICSEKTFVIETIDERILLQKYLASVMLSDDFWNYCEENKSGGVNYFLNWSTLADYEFELPSVEEQKAISDKVWAAYRLKESYKKLLAATEEMVKSQFIEMFEGDKYPHEALDSIAADWLKGQPFRKDEIEESGIHSCIHYGELFTKYGPIISQVQSYTSSEPKRLSKSGDILFPASDVTPNGLARCSMLPFDDVILGGDIIILRPKEGFNSGFLSYAINNQTSQLLTRVNGGVVKHMSSKSLKSVLIPIPPMDKQEEYIGIAHQADKSEFDGFKSQFIEMFGDPMVNDKQWSDYPCLSEVTQIVLGSTPNSKEPSYWDGDIRWITPAEMTDQSYYIYDTVRHITEEGRDAANLTMLPEGAVLFSTRAPIGKVAIVGKEMCCNQGFKNFICSEKLNKVFLYYTLKYKKDHLCSLGTGTTFKELSKKTVESLKIAVPPIDLQERFEDIYNQADKSEFELRKSIDAIDAVIKSLINS